MADTQSLRAPRMRQARKSMSHLPSPDITGDKENATLDTGELSALTIKSKQTAKKSRSKSLGPGGIDALKEGTGNNGKVDNCAAKAHHLFADVCHSHNSLM